MIYGVARDLLCRKRGSVQEISKIVSSNTGSLLLLKLKSFSAGLLEHVAADPPSHCCHDRYQKTIFQIPVVITSGFGVA